MFKNSGFQENLKDSNLAILKMKKGTNIISVLVSDENGEKVSDKGKKNFRIITTDTVENINVYVRITLNVSVFDWSSIDAIRECARTVSKGFCDANGIFEENHEYVRDVTEGNYGNIAIVSHITVDIPYVRDQLTNVNGCIKTIIDTYLDYCDKLRINNSDERYILAKFVAKVNTLWDEDSFNGFVAANYQRANTRSTAIHGRINVPKRVHVKKNDRNIIGCNLTTVNNLDANKPIEMIFDDKLKIFEFHVLRFIKKTETQSFPQLASRTILIHKNNKNDGPLIHNDRVSITVGLIDFCVKDNVKVIRPFDEFIGNLLILGNKTQEVNRFKFTNEFVNTAKSVAGKVMKFYSQNSEPDAEATVNAVEQPSQPTE